VTAYPAYSDSGIEWIGDIPEGWRVRPFFTAFDAVRSKNSDLDEQNLLSLSYGRIVRKDIDTSVGLLPESFETYQVIDCDDIVFRFTDLQNDKRSLRSALSSERGIITSAYLAVRARSDSPSYLAYLMRAYDVQKVFYSMGGGLRQSMKFDDVKRLPLLLPPLDEQQLIAEYLDRETGKIDILIAKQEQLVATLAERRQALITRSTTRGLSPGLELQDSGDMVVGPVPSGWSIRRLRDLITEVSSGRSVNAIDTPVVGDELGVLKTSSVSAGEFRPTENKTILEDERHLATGSVQAGTLLVNRANSPAYVGAAALVEQSEPNLFLSDKLWSVRFADLQPAFVWWWTKTRVYRDQVGFEIVGASSSMQNLSFERFREIRIAVPPEEDQDAIVNDIKTATEKIDALATSATAVIALLRERRQALISAAVTGKIDVRGF
jgi:type I restriction enzyme, S subunit